jgi:hypothetical protein
MRNYARRLSGSRRGVGNGTRPPDSVDRLRRRGREQVRALHRHYETLARDAAIRALDRALADAEAKIERAPAKVLPARAPYPQLARPGRVWVKSGRYWVGYQTDPAPVIVAVFYETANIPGRL